MHCLYISKFATYIIKGYYIISTSNTSTPPPCRIQSPTNAKVFVIAIFNLVFILKVQRIFSVAKYISILKVQQIFSASYISILKVQRMSCVGPLSLPHCTTSATSIGRWIYQILQNIFWYMLTHSPNWRFSLPAKSTLFANLTFYSKNPDTFTR